MGLTAKYAGFSFTTQCGKEGRTGAGTNWKPNSLEQIPSSKSEGRIFQLLGKASLCFTGISIQGQELRWLNETYYNQTLVFSNHSWVTDTNQTANIQYVGNVTVWWENLVTGIKKTKTHNKSIVSVTVNNTQEKVSIGIRQYSRLMFNITNNYIQIYSNFSLLQLLYRNLRCQGKKTHGFRKLQLQMTMQQGFQPIPPEDEDYEHPLDKVAASFYSPLYLHHCKNPKTPISDRQQGDLHPQAAGTMPMLRSMQLQKLDQPFTP